METISFKKSCQQKIENSRQGLDHVMIHELYIHLQLITRSGIPA